MYHTHPAAPSYRADLRWCKFDDLFPFLDIKFHAKGHCYSQSVLSVNYPFCQHSLFQFKMNTNIMPAIISTSVYNGIALPLFFNSAWPSFTFSFLAC